MKIEMLFSFFFYFDKNIDQSARIKNYDNRVYPWNIYIKIWLSRVKYLSPNKNTNARSDIRLKAEIKSQSEKN